MIWFNFEMKAYNSFLSSKLAHLVIGNRKINNVNLKGVGEIVYGCDISYMIMKNLKDDNALYRFAPCQKHMAELLYNTDRKDFGFHDWIYKIEYSKLVTELNTYPFIYNNSVYLDQTKLQNTIKIFENLHKYNCNPTVFKLLHTAFFDYDYYAFGHYNLVNEYYRDIITDSTNQIKDLPY